MKRLLGENKNWSVTSAKKENIMHAFYDRLSLIATQLRLALL